jgi:hypothetical protein
LDVIEQVSGQIQRAFTMAGIHSDQSFNQTEFVDVYRKAVLALAQCLREKPLTVAYSEKMFDGSSITALLKDKPALDAALSEAWQAIPKSSAGSVPKPYLRVGLDVFAPYAGLPPIGAVEEVCSSIAHLYLIKSFCSNDTALLSLCSSSGDSGS